jgi:acetyl esterase/lipase
MCIRPVAPSRNSSLRCGPSAGGGVGDRCADSRRPTRDGVIMARLYRPLSAGPDDVLPVAFYFHGGGWCVGDIPSYDACAASWPSRRWRCCRWITGWRRSIRFGAVMMRCMRCLEPRQRRPARHRSGRFALAGDSAGGTLSAVTALQLRNERPAGALQLLIYPCTDILSQRRRGAPLPAATFWIPRASPGSSRSTCPIRTTGRTGARRRCWPGVSMVCRRRPSSRRLRSAHR